MRKFTTGLLIGGVATMAGISYLMQDQKTYRKMMKNGKKMAVKAEEVIDDMMDDLIDK
ncbi:hypothetical protein [Anaerotignum sp. MB30-C6]|uniref:hypothetical protein n=1 Tax=Anaerotignum sp. MB30-C6 TaxID=3070814 RepID=UPI0027DE15F5|nr:hypothetical protein [Anaerotignum sp. MB30-C6]WMI81068.1 hypothetical protein RBQ60_14855 [Anaerotignum sp. MB30-C6]